MKTATVLLCAMLATVTGFAQQINRVRQWVPINIQSADVTDRSKQIKNIVITNYTGNCYTGTIEYGQSAGVTHPCTVIMTGKNITIRSDKQSWTGKVLGSGLDIMVVSLGSVVYSFKMAPENQRSHTEAPVVAAN